MAVGAANSLGEEGRRAGARGHATGAEPGERQSLRTEHMIRMDDSDRN